MSLKDTTKPAKPVKGKAKSTKPAKGAVKPDTTTDSAHINDDKPEPNVWVIPKPSVKGIIIGGAKLTGRTLLLVPKLSYRMVKGSIKTIKEEF